MTTRLAAILLLILGAVLLAFFVRESLAVVYLRGAQTPTGQIQLATDRTLHLTGFAARMSPWSARQRAEHAWLLALRQDHEQHEMHMLQALRWAPSDPYVWNRRSESLIRQRRFGEDLILAVQRTNAISPHAPPLQARHALHAVQYWPRAPQPLRAEWMKSARYMVRLFPRQYVEEILRRGRAPHFCAYMAEELDLLDWCDQAAEAIHACRQPGLRPRQHQWCEKMNLLP